MGHGVYPMPVGGVGLSMVDTRDIAEIAALELLRRDQAPGPLPREVIDLVGPDVLTGAVIAGLWSEALDKTVTYAGDDLPGFEQTAKGFMPGWMAYDMRLMCGRFQLDGMVADAGDVERLTRLLGRPLHSYKDFAVETAKAWAAA